MIRSARITNKFIPADVRNYDDEIHFISITDLQCKKHIEIYVAQFTPSFFWIHLRENINSFHFVGAKVSINIQQDKTQNMVL